MFYLSSTYLDANHTVFVICGFIITKVRLVKAMVFPVVMYGSESWTVKKAEREELMLLNRGVGEDS